MSTEKQPGHADPTPPLSSHGAARRRLTKAGLGVASVLWTLESRADMKPMACFAPSAGYSGKLSSNYNQAVVCSGKSPGYWKNHGGWPCGSDTPFRDVFGCSAGNEQTYGVKSLLEIVRGCDFDKYNIGVHLVATYLNVLSKRIGFLTVPQLKDMWAQLQRHQYYQPAKNVYWSIEQTKQYLEATHD